VVTTVVSGQIDLAESGGREACRVVVAEERVSTLRADGQATATWPHTRHWQPGRVRADRPEGLSAVIGGANSTACGF